MFPPPLRIRKATFSNSGTLSLSPKLDFPRSYRYLNSEMRTAARRRLKPSTISGIILTAGGLSNTKTKMFLMIMRTVTTNATSSVRTQMPDGRRKPKTLLVCVD
jgi:hypothetical protein